MVGHNIRFDMKQIKGSFNVWIDRKATTFCTMQASMLLGNSVGMGRSRGHKLCEIARDFLDLDLDKTEQASDWSVPELTPEQLEYAALDVVSLHDLMRVFKDALLTVLHQYNPLELEMAVIGPTARMEWNGMPFNKDVYLRVQEAARFAMPALLSRIGKIFRDEIGQPPILARVPIEKNDGTTVWQEMYLPWCDGKVGKDFLMSRQGPASKVGQIITKMGLLDEDGEPLSSTKKGMLDPLRKENPGIGFLLDYWDLVKQSQFSYADYIHPLTGRCHPRFTISGAGTGRFTSSNFNGQQIPTRFNLIHAFTKEKLNYRMCFEAEPGKLVSSADLSGQELTVMAKLSGDQLMIKTINDGGDLHSEAAAGLFNIDPKDARQPIPGLNGVTYRDRGKICVAAGTRVSTDHGMLPIEKVTPGMKAYTDQGLETVTAFIDNGVRDTIKLTLEGGFELECTPDHELRVIDANGDYLWREAGQIFDTDHVALKPGVGAEGPAQLPYIHVDQTTVTSHKVVVAPTQWTPELARFLGYFISEGSLTHWKTSYHASYAQALGPIADDMESVAKAVWGSACTTLLTKPGQVHHLVQKLMQFNRRDIFNWLTDIGCGPNSAGREVPEIVFQSPLWAQREFLRALYAGDGCICRNGAKGINISYSTKSHLLAKQVQQLVLNLGCLVSLYATTRKDYPGEIYWCVQSHDAEKFLDVIGVAFKELAFVSYKKTIDLTELPCQQERIRILQPLLLGKLDQFRMIAGAPYFRSHKEKLYECIRKKNPVRLNYSRLDMVLSESHLHGHPTREYLADLRHRALAYRKVVKVEVSEAFVYDITVENQHCFLANGVVAHNCMFSLAYGKTEKGFSADWNMPEDETKKLIGGFKKRFKTLTDWLDREGRLGSAQSFATLVNGAMRFVGGGESKADKSGAVRQSSNYMIQGLSSWAIRHAMIELDRRITAEDLDIQLSACIHDELLSVIGHWEGCPYALLRAGTDSEFEALSARASEADKAKDKDTEKALKVEMKAHELDVINRCKTACVGQQCAHRNESVIGECMQLAADTLLEGVVRPPEAYSIGTAKYWKH